MENKLISGYQEHGLPCLPLAFGLKLCIDVAGFHIAYVILYVQNNFLVAALTASLSRLYKKFNTILLFVS